MAPLSSPRPVADSCVRIFAHGPAHRRGEADAPAVAPTKCLDEGETARQPHCHHLRLPSCFSISFTGSHPRFHRAVIPWWCRGVFRLVLMVRTRLARLSSPEARENP